MDDNRITALEEKYANLDEKFNRLQSTLERQWIRIDAHFHEEESIKTVVTSLAETAHKIEITLAGLPIITERQVIDKTNPLWDSVHNINKSFDDFRLDTERARVRVKNEGIVEMKAWINSHLYIIWIAAGIFYTLAGSVFMAHIDDQKEVVAEVKANQDTIRKLTTELAVLAREHSEGKP